MSPQNRAIRASIPFVAVPAVVVALVLLFTVGWIGAVIALVVIAAAITAWVRLAAFPRVTAHVGGRPADPRADARLWNLVEGLSTAAGVRQPELRVLDCPGLNVLSAGTGPSKSVLAVTSGLLTELDRVELEAVLAEEVYLIRHGETLPGTVLAATFGIGGSLALAPDADARADQGAISLTRYPPALASALEKIERKGSAVPGQPGYMAQLWLADPRPSGATASGRAPTRGRLPLTERVEALREL